MQLLELREYASRLAGVREIAPCTEPTHERCETQTLRCRRRLETGSVWKIASTPREWHRELCSALLEAQPLDVVVADSNAVKRRFGIIVFNQVMSDACFV